MAWPFTEKWQLKRDIKKADTAAKREKAKFTKMNPSDPNLKTQETVCQQAIKRLSEAQAAYDRWLARKLLKRP